MHPEITRPELDFGDRVWELRSERGWSQIELARQAGMSPATINYLEAGKKQPTLQSIRKLAKTFGIPTRELIMDEEPRGNDTGHEMGVAPK